MLATMQPIDNGANYQPKLQARETPSDPQNRTHRKLSSVLGCDVWDLGTRILQINDSKMIKLHNIKNWFYLPNIYINMYWVSVERPATKRPTEKNGSELTNELIKSPIAPVNVVRMQAGKRPIRSARHPKKMVPITEPTKKKD